MIAVDIETVPDEERIKSRQWEEFKAKKGIEKDQDAALYPAFGRIVSICAYDMETKTFMKRSGDDETSLLSGFSLMLSPNAILGGHNIKSFDIPFLGLRYVANSMFVPQCMRFGTKKPWEILHVDTIELLKFGGNGYVSLDAACLMFGIPSPKEGEVNALGVWDAYKAGSFDLITEYCAKDVKAWIKLYNKLKSCGVCQ